MHKIQVSKYKIQGSRSNTPEGTLAPYSVFGSAMPNAAIGHIKKKSIEIRVLCVRVV
jgi:hypothetical protein